MHHGSGVISVDIVQARVDAASIVKNIKLIPIALVVEGIVVIVIIVMIGYSCLRSGSLYFDCYKSMDYNKMGC